MIASPNFDYISPEEYLKTEELSPIKHEYRNGEVYAMAGASNTHVLIAGNLVALLEIISEEAVAEHTYQIQKLILKQFIPITILI